MSTPIRDEQLDRRVEELIANDPQFAAAQPDPAIIAALEQPGLRLPQIIRTVLDGYAERPALAQRVVEFVKDAKTGRTSAELLPASRPSRMANWANGFQPSAAPGPPTR